MIETINIWRRSYDGKYSVCVLWKQKDDTFKRDKTNHDDLASLMDYLREHMKINEYDGHALFI